MPIRVEILPDYVHVSWHGKLVEEDLAHLSREMLRIGMQLGKAPNVLHTFDEVDGMGLKSDTLFEHGVQLDRIKLPNPCRVASVCLNPLAYGMGRMLQIINRNADLQIEVFSDLEAARHWLKSAPSVPPFMPESKSRGGIALQRQG